MDPVRYIVKLLLGTPTSLPSALTDRFPELRLARYRRGGLPPRVGGWALGRRTVAGITLGKTVFLSHEAPLSAELLLHELRHVQQFGSVRAFPLRYLWESVRRGYARNRYELDARAWAALRLRAGARSSLSQEP